MAAVKECPVGVLVPVDEKFCCQSFSCFQTAELDQKMKGLGEDSLRNFTLDTAASGSIFEFEGKDFRKAKVRQLLVQHRKDKSL